MYTIVKMNTSVDSGKERVVTAGEKMTSRLKTCVALVAVEKLYQL